MGAGQPRELAPAATAQPWPDLSPLAPGRASGKPGAPGKPRKIPGQCTPKGLPRARDPGPWGPAPLRLAAVIFRKSEIKDGWRSGPERLGRRSAGGKARGEKAKTLKKFLKREILCPSPPPLRALQSPQSGWPAPQLPEVGRGRAPSPRLAREGRVQQIALPPGGLPGVRPFSGLLEKPQGVREKVGTPGVFQIGRAHV